MPPWEENSATLFITKFIMMTQFRFHIDQNRYFVTNSHCQGTLIVIHPVI